MDDLISRQAAIDEIDEWIKAFRESGHKQSAADARLIQDGIIQLPSAQLGTNLAEVGTDCICRQAAIDAIEEKQLPIMRSEFLYDQAKFDGLSVALNIITELSSAHPEIIRCKDCKHWIPYDWMFSEIWKSRNMADYPEDEIGCDCCDMAMKANDFCSRSERREVTE